MDNFGFYIFLLFAGIVMGVFIASVGIEVLDIKEDEAREMEIIELKSEVEVYKKILKEHYVVEEEWVYVRERENNGDSKEIRGK